LLNHVAGFVTDDPWGDRQTPMVEAEFTALLRSGVPFTRPPAMAFEYSNLGYGILGRIITNVSKRPFEETITKTLITPLGMTSTGFDAGSAAIERRALGYRWEDNAWKPEPYLGPGAFGAMGGIQTNANDYAKWVAFLLSAWPPRDGKQVGPIDRASVRELAEGSNFPQFGQRPGHHATETCKLARNYGMGMIVARDCELGMTLYHSGGYPGYGSHLLLMPERGIGIFAFANRTYAAPSAAVWDAAIALNKAGQLPAQRSIPANADLTRAYDQIRRIYQTGNLDGADNDLAMNFLLDRDRAAWARELARLKEQAGDCDPSAAFQPTGALSADFTWRCAHGRVRGSFQLSPTLPPRIQQLDINILKP
jgi:CubicO group peptidase (beta-lactamase class C family)